MAGTRWSLEAEYLQACNCDWGCPCNFNARPTGGHCEGGGAYRIRRGRYGGTRLDGLNVAWMAWWPGQIHEGGGTGALYVDERAKGDQRSALVDIFSGQAGGMPFGLVAKTFARLLPPRFTQVEVKGRGATASCRAGGYVGMELEPMKNPVTGAKVRGRVVLPDGFIFKEADVLSLKSFWVHDEKPLHYEHLGTNGHYATVKYRGP